MLLQLAALEVTLVGHHAEIRCPTKACSCQGKPDTFGVMMPDGTVEAVGGRTPEGGSIRVLLSHVSRHDVLDVWLIERRRQQLEDEAYGVRYPGLAGLVPLNPPG